MATKKKRVSKVVHECSVHGRFKGYEWGGHRRVCNAKEVVAGGKKGSLMGRTIKTLQRAHAAKYPTRAATAAVRVKENSEIPMADSVALRKPVSEMEKILFEIGIKRIEFSASSKPFPHYIDAKVVETVKDHPALLPYVAGDVITGVEDMPFMSDEKFASLVKEGIERKTNSIWVCFKHGDAAAIRRTVTLRSSHQNHSSGDFRELLGHPGGASKSRFQVCLNVIGVDRGTWIPEQWSIRMDSLMKSVDTRRFRFLGDGQLTIGGFITGINEQFLHSQETFCNLVESFLKSKDSVLHVSHRDDHRGGKMMLVTVNEHEKADFLRLLPTATSEASPKVEKTIFVPSSDIIMKVEQRLKSLDALIANTKAEAKMHTDASLRLAKELRDAREFALASDKQVGELQGQRKEFLRKLAAFTK